MFSHATPRVLTSLVLGLLLTLAGCSREEPRQLAQDHAKRSQAYSEQGQHRAAMIEATNAVNAAPQEVEHRVGLARIYNTVGSYRRTAALLEDVIETHPQEAALTLAEAYLALGRFLSAREALDGFNPTSAEESRQKDLFYADSYRVQGNFEQAHESYQALLQQTPGDTEIILRLVENDIAKGEPNSARQRLEPLLQAQPADAKALRLGGYLALARNDLDLAERRLTQALIDQPRSDVMLPERARVLRLLADTVTAQGRSTEALVYNRLLAEGNESAVAARQRFSEALAAVESGRRDEAINKLREILRDNPEHQPTAIMLGVLSLEGGDITGASDLLSANVDVETANASVIRATVLAQTQVGDAEQALATLERAMQAHPQDLSLLAMHGLLSISMPGRERQGYMSLQKALSFDPAQSRLRLALARYYFDRGEAEQGMAQLRSAFRDNPTDWVVSDVYLSMLFAQNQLAELETAIARLRSANAAAVETRLYTAQLAFRQGNANDAVRQMQRIVTDFPQSERAHAVFAQMQRERGDFPNALAQLERVLALNPTNLAALQGGAQLSAQHNLAGGPQAWLDSQARLHGSDPVFTLHHVAMQALLYRDAGDFDRANALLEPHGESDNLFVQQAQSLIYRDLAAASAMAGDRDRARGLLQKALAKFPDNRVLSIDLVRLDLSVNRLTEAAALLSDLEARFPGDPELISVRTLYLQRAENDASAYRHIKAAWTAQPRAPLAPLLMSLAKTQAPADVGGILQSWRQIAPDDRVQLLHSALWYQEQNNTRQAVANYERLIQQNAQDAVALNNLAWLLKDSEIDRALGYAERAVALQPDVAAILDTYGWLLHLKGQHADALVQLERAVELAPQAEDIRQHRDTVKAKL